MKPCTIFIIVFFLFYSCSNPGEEPGSISHKTDTITQVRKPLTTKQRALTSEESFQIFWKKFRAAVIAGDTSTVLSLTRFPFETRGPLDDDAVVKYSKARFPKVLNAFLNQDNGMDLNGSPEWNTLEKEEHPDPKHINGNYARVGDLVFFRDDLIWKFGFVYLNYETIESLGR